MWGGRRGRRHGGARDEALRPRCAHCAAGGEERERPEPFRAAVDRRPRSIQNKLQAILQLLKFRTSSQFAPGVRSCPSPVTPVVQGRGRSASARARARTEGPGSEAAGAVSSDSAPLACLGVDGPTGRHARAHTPGVRRPEQPPTRRVQARPPARALARSDETRQPAARERERARLRSTPKPFDQLRERRSRPGVTAHPEAAAPGARCAPPPRPRAAPAAAAPCAPARADGMRTVAPIRPAVGARLGDARLGCAVGTLGARCSERGGPRPRASSARPGLRVAIRESGAAPCPLGLGSCLHRHAGGAGPIGGRRPRGSSRHHVTATMLRTGQN